MDYPVTKLGGVVGAQSIAPYPYGRGVVQIAELVAGQFMIGLWENDAIARWDPVGSESLVVGGKTTVSSQNLPRVSGEEMKRMSGFVENGRESVVWERETRLSREEERKDGTEEGECVDVGWMGWHGLMGGGGTSRYLPT
ncbi:hypothetical protein NLG97_g8357 [Lecanicillium saksenae]|uniref:Uncharacterized protein n=1 Tax=Lecanicillium saksenae TaxID=468837 RepID=A0ACC1QLT3_9HYPO|nr:hypothetical protein NLG97_g8357 [Lecanicillium saksenae]